MADVVPGPDLDPATQPGDEAPTTEDVNAANYGLDGRGDLPEETEGLDEGLEIVPGQPTLLQVRINDALAFLDACVKAVPRVRYKLGAKVSPGLEPGNGLKAVDCSGFVREEIRRSTDLGRRFPDGSAVQHEWVKAHGFEPIAREQGATKDGFVRIAFLSPGDSAENIGHVVLLYRGLTLESHGGVGPDSRPWTMKGWQAKASVYLLGLVSTGNA